MSNLVTVRDNHLTCKGVHVVQYGDTQEQLMSLLQQGYQLTYYLENPPEEGKLTLSKPNDDSITGGCVNPCGHLELRLTLSSDQIPDNLTDYYNVLYPPDFNGPRGTADVYSADVRAFMQNILTAYTTLLREYELNPPETTPDITVTDTTDTTVTDLTMSPDLIDFINSNDVTVKPSYITIRHIVDDILAQITATTDTTDPGLPVPFGPQPQINIDPEYAKQLEEQFKNLKIRLVGFGEEPVHFHFFYDSEESDTPSRFELVRIGDSDWTNEQVASFAASMIEKSSWDEQQKALMREAVDEFRANPKMAQSYYEYQRSLTIISTMDAETEAVTSVQVASAEDGGWRTIGTLNNPGGIDWKYQAGNLTGSGTASVVWHAQELGALGVWTDGTDNWTAVDGWFDTNWTMLGCGDFDGDGKDSVLMSLNGGLFYSVDLDGTLSSLGDLNWSGWEFGAVGDFAGDGRDDIVLLHRESGTVVLLADGNADSFERLGQLDASDWSVAGAGDFDADGKDDLLVRQNSTGIAGAYASADMSKWSTVSSDYLLA